MFIFKRAHRRIVKSIGSKSSEEVLQRLASFLDAESPQIVNLLYSVFQDQQNAVTYEELRKAVIDGYDQEILQWQNDYTNMVNEKLAPMWLAAIKAGAKQFEEKVNGLFFDYSDSYISDWMDTHCSEFITNIGEETQMAVKSILYYGQQQGWNTDQMARAIRPCIGQTRGDAMANVRYQQSIYNSLIEQHPNMTEENAAKKAQEAALKYAGRQHRRRAEMIANTEMAFAYNRGAHESVRQAMRQGLMGPVEKVWSTAGSERVCPRCSALNGTVVGFDDAFDTQGEQLFPGMNLTPPAHPRCRCVVMYRQIAPPAGRKDDLMVEAPKMDDKFKERVWSQTGLDEVPKNIHQLVDSRMNDQYAIIDALLPKPMALSTRDGLVHINPDNPAFGLYDLPISMAHEFIHQIDYENGISGQLAFELAADLVAATEEIGKSYESVKAKLWGTSFKDNMFLGDLFSAVAMDENIAPAGHKDEYWGKSFGLREMELCSDIMTLYCMDDKQAIKYVKGFAGLADIFDKVVKAYVPYLAE